MSDDLVRKFQDCVHLCTSMELQIQEAAHAFDLMMAILVRNRSHLPVAFDEPVFEIRGVKSVKRTYEQHRDDKEITELKPGESAHFHREFHWWDFIDDYRKVSPDEFDFDRFVAWLEENARKECKIVDLGPRGA